MSATTDEIIAKLKEDLASRSTLSDTEGLHAIATTLHVMVGIKHLETIIEKETKNA